MRLPAHNVEELRLLIMSRLPAQSRWLMRETPVRWDFSRATQPLQSLPEDDAAEWKNILPTDWRQIMIFGERDIAEGGGANPFLGIHAQTGEVLGLDVERDRSAVFLLNSSVPAFIDAFLILEKALKVDKQVPRDLKNRLRDLDPDAFDRSEWRELVDYLDESTDNGA